MAKTSSKDELNLVSLFSGGGGLDIGLGAAGFKTLTGYAVDATYTTSCTPPPMMEDLGFGSVAITRPASL